MKGLYWWTLTLLWIGVQSASDWCNGASTYPKNYSVPVSELGNGISIGGTIVCNSGSPEDQFFILTLVGPADKWFGIPFGTSMLADAVIYTTGKTGGDNVKLYDYKNTDHSLSGVHKDDSQDWNEISTVTADGKVTLIYSRLLDTGDDQDRVFTGNSQTLSVMYAIAGSGLAITSQHRTQSSKYYVLNFVEGTTTSHDLPGTRLKKWHGGVMWFAWNVFGYAGVIAARFKDYIVCLAGTLANKQRWFWFHVSCMVTAATLTITGFVLAVVAREKNNEKHFNTAHTIIGLIILILVIFQPLNALVRPHKQDNVTKQPWPRRIWEFIHKNNGRTIVALTIFNVFSGLVLLGISMTIIVLQIIYICLLGASVLILDIYVACYEHRHEDEASKSQKGEEGQNTDTNRKTFETESLRDIENPDKFEVEM